MIFRALKQSSSRYWVSNKGEIQYEPQALKLKLLFTFIIGQGVVEMVMFSCQLENFIGWHKTICKMSICIVK